MFSLRITSLLRAAEGRPVVPYHYVQVRFFQQRSSQRVTAKSAPNHRVSPAFGPSASASAPNAGLGFLAGLPTTSLVDDSDSLSLRSGFAASHTADERSVSGASLGGNSDFSRKRSGREDDYGNSMTSSGGGSWGARLSTTPRVPSVNGQTFRSDPKSTGTSPLAQSRMSVTSTTAVHGNSGKAVPVHEPYVLEDTLGEVESEDAIVRSWPPSDSVIPFHRHSPDSVDAQDFTSLALDVLASDLDALAEDFNSTLLASPTPKKSRWGHETGSSLHGALYPQLPPVHEISIVSEDASLNSSYRVIGQTASDSLLRGSERRTRSGSDFELESALGDDDSPSDSLRKY